MTHDEARWEDEGGFVQRELDALELSAWRIGDYVMDTEGRRGYITAFKAKKIYTSIGVFAYWPHELTRLNDY